MRPVVLQVQDSKSSSPVNVDSKRVKSNIHIILRAISKGVPDPNTDFGIQIHKIDLDNLKLKNDEIVLRTLFVSLDPYMRGLIREPKPREANPPYLVGQPMYGGVVAEVVKSNNTGYVKGDVVSTLANWAEYSVINPAVVLGGATKIPNPRESKFPLSYFLGVFGLPGLTAYIGLHKICEPLSPGQTLYVSAASGAVGQVVGQYGKALGFRVVGSAGDDSKVDYLLQELGFDAAFNYKKHSDLTTILKETCPNGIDIYYENVGGKMLDAVLVNCNRGARIAVSGMISQYNRTHNLEPVYNITEVVHKELRIQGFQTASNFREFGTQAIQTLMKLVLEGKLKYREDVTEGIETLPEAFVGMLEGKNFGKAVVHVADL